MNSLRLSLGLAASSLLAAATLTHCHEKSPVTRQPSPLFKDHDLHFDMRYYDSIDMDHRSARTERERAIFTQLQRLEDIEKDFLNAEGKLVPLSQQPNPPIEESIGGGPVRHFAGKAEELADIYHKIDSLKILEHISPAPH